MQRTGERFDVGSRDRIDVAWNLKVKRNQFGLKYKPGGLDVETNRDRDRERP